MKKYRSLQLVQNNPFVKKFLLITVAFIVLWILLMFLPWQQIAKGVGQVVALNPMQRDYEIRATINGFLEKVAVHENQFVHKGDLLFELRDYDSELAQRYAAIIAASQKQEQALLAQIVNTNNTIEHENKILHRTQDSYRKKLRQQQNSYSALQEQKIAAYNDLTLQKRNYDRAASLYKDGIVSKLSLDTAYNKFLKSQANYKQVSVAAQNQEQKIAMTKNDMHNFTAQTRQKINTLHNKLLKVDNELQKVKQTLQRNELAGKRYELRKIRAKSDGYIIQIYANDTNRLIHKGEKILYFSPQVQKRAIRLELSDFVMPLVKKGLKVRIIFYGWPAMQIAGWPKISHGTYGGIIDSVERSAHSKGKYYVLIVEDPNDVPWPNADNLKIGTQASAWVQFGVVPIWYEIWRLIVAQPPKMVKHSESIETLF